MVNFYHSGKRSRFESRDWKWAVFNPGIEFPNSSDGAWMTLASVGTEREGIPQGILSYSYSLYTTLYSSHISDSSLGHHLFADET